MVNQVSDAISIGRSVIRNQFPRQLTSRLPFRRLLGNLLRLHQRPSLPLRSRDFPSCRGTHGTLRADRLRRLRFRFDRSPPLPLSRRHPSPRSRAHGAPASLDRRCGRHTVSGTELSTDVGYLLFNIPLHLLESDQRCFEEGCVGCSLPCWHVCKSSPGRYCLVYSSNRADYNSARLMQALVVLEAPSPGAGRA
jgi:hypothetical protein